AVLCTVPGTRFRATARAESSLTLAFDTRLSGTLRLCPGASWAARLPAANDNAAQRVRVETRRIGVSPGKGYGRDILRPRHSGGRHRSRKSPPRTATSSVGTAKSV